MDRFKYPRTAHLPFSPGTTSDDKLIDNLDGFVGQEIVITEKMDGENTTMYRDGIHARSLDSRHHASRDWVKGFHATIAHDIPQDCRICGENVFAQHSIPYVDLESYFLGFSLWMNDECFDWDTTMSVFGSLGIQPVRQIYRGQYSLDTLVDLTTTLDNKKHEGVVVRVTRQFHMVEFPRVVAKWVRSGHVTSDDHWMHKPVIPNRLKP